MAFEFILSKMKTKMKVQIMDVGNQCQLARILVPMIDWLLCYCGAGDHETITHAADYDPHTGLRCCAFVAFDSDVALLQQTSIIPPNLSCVFAIFNHKNLNKKNGYFFHSPKVLGWPEAGVGVRSSHSTCVLISRARLQPYLLIATPATRHSPPPHTVSTSAVDDPSVSKSVFTITEKAPN